MSRINPAPQDGRAFTVYNSSCGLNADIQNKFGIKSEGEYRMFLQQNPDKIMTFVNTQYTQPFEYWSVQTCPSSYSATDDVLSKPYAD